MNGNVLRFSRYSSLAQPRILNDAWVVNLREKKQTLTGKMMGIFKNKKLLHELSKSVGSLEERFEEFVEGEETRGEISNNIYGVKRDVESLQAQIKSLEATMHNKDCLVELLLNLNERDYRLIPQAGAVYDPEDVPSKNRAKALEEGFEYVKPIGKLGELWVKKGKKEAVKEDKKDDK